MRRDLHKQIDAARAHLSGVDDLVCILSNEIEDLEHERDSLQRDFDKAELELDSCRRIITGLGHQA